MRRFKLIVRAIDATLTVIVGLALTTMAAAFAGWCAGCLLGMAWGAHFMDAAKAAGEKTSNSMLLNPVGHLAAAMGEFGLFTGPLWYVRLAYRARRSLAAAPAASPAPPPRSGEQGKG